MGVAHVFFRDLLYYPVAWIQAGDVRRHEKFLARTQFAPRQEIRALQEGRLRSLLDHARREVPFYRDLAPSVTSLDRISELPFLLKTDLQEHHADLRSTASLGRLALKTTGGSTGQPVTLVKTREALAWELAATWRGYSWAGVGAGDRQARFWGVPHDSSSHRKAQLIDFVCNRMRIPAFNFSETDMEAYLVVLRKKKPRYFYGYVSMLAEFARFLDRRGESLGFDLKCVISTSEVLGEAERQLLSRVFQAPVFNEYGCGELGTVAHECEKGSLHLSEENMVVEIYDGDRPAGPGEPGELVVTELNNLGFPLIRYRTGDFGTLQEGTCSCGRTLRCLAGIQGRAYDFIRNREGVLFHGEFIMYIFEDLRRQKMGIRQFQVIQEDVDHFSVKIVRETAYRSEAEAIIIERIRQEVDPEARLDFTYVDEITREKSGKLRLIKGLG